ncbi:Cullin repeat-like-containing domain-containing protein [Artemisia annua]|uniref:Exocyst subunit Exo70 family protein n=1 Tax=Artemisia annua TaxID=35608 RepID=A0A2U1QFA5_ARTAN|nr:Cullin repeat-like-containing domain-containing protein [Artemisia annua]
MDNSTAEEIILRWDTSSSLSDESSRTTTTTTTRTMLFDSDNRHDIDQYLNAIDHLHKTQTQNDTVSQVNNNSNNKKVNSTLQIAMARLEDEFRHLLISRASPIDTDSVSDSSLTPRASTRHSFSELDDLTDDVTTPSSDTSTSRGMSLSLTSYRSMSSIRELDLMTSDDVSELKSVGERMIGCGYSRECVQVYAGVRKVNVETSFKKLGVEKLSIGDIQRLEWEALNAKIGKWIRAAKTCIRVLFASEKKLCEQIFLGNENVGEACFMETVKGPAVQLFNFAEAISISRRAPEKLFKILDLYDTLCDLVPDIEVVFDGGLGEGIRVQANEILSRLGEAARGMLNEFENAVLREPSRVPVPGGTIHPLTRYVMNYISLISDYKQTLGELIVARPATGSRYSDDVSTPDMDFTDHEEQSPLALHLIWIIVILQFNLEGKSKHYKDTSLAHLFVMNNVHYIVQKVKGSPELREMIGDIYLKKLTGKYRQAATSYQRATWLGVLYYLRDEGLHVSGSFSSGVSKSALRERFKSFNGIFEEVHRTQALWLIPDTQLREELRISISELLIPAYRSFLGRFRSHIESGRHPENYIKYSVEDIETAVLDFFEGCAVSQHSRRRSQ